MSLRPGRAAAPGAPDQPRAKRPSSEVATEKLAKEKEKQTKSAATARNIEKLARLELKMQEDDTRLDRDANHPSTEYRQKQPRTVIEAPKQKKQGTFHALPLETHRDAILQAIVDEVPDSEDDTLQDTNKGQPSEGGDDSGGGHDFIPGSEDERSEDETMEMEIAEKGKAKMQTAASKVANLEKKPTKPVVEKGKANTVETLQDKKRAKMAFREQVMATRVDVQGNTNSAGKQKHSAADVIALYV